MGDLSNNILTLNQAKASYVAHRLHARTRMVSCVMCQTRNLQATILYPPLAEMVVCLLKTTVLSLSMVEGVSVGLA